MFSVLVIADDAGFFRRRRLFRAPQVRDVRVYGGLPFREIISARRRGKINRAAICEAAGRCSGTMLLPEDIRARSLRLQKARFLQHCVLYIALVLRVRSARRAADKRQKRLRCPEARHCSAAVFGYPRRDFVSGRVFAPDRKRHGRIRRGGSRRNQRQRGCSYRPRFVARKVCLRRRSFYGGKNNAPERICASHADGRRLA